MQFVVLQNKNCAKKTLKNFLWFYLQDYLLGNFQITSNAFCKTNLMQKPPVVQITFD